MGSQRARAGAGTEAGVGDGGSGTGGVQRAGVRGPPPSGFHLEGTQRSFPSVHFASDLSLGSVLLFPIDDKESRNEGRDLVSKKEKNKNPLLLELKLGSRPPAALPRAGHAADGAAVLCHVDLACGVS